jgi:putative PEP-CTERM system TPR-repeat lipoprotein
MFMTDFTSTSKRLSALLPILAMLVLTGCGLTMDNEERLDRAEAAYADGEYRAAIIDAKNVLLEEPGSRRARLLLGRASIRVGDAAAAEKELTRAVELGSEFADVAVDLGQALLLLNEFQRVIDEIAVEAVATDGAKSSILRVRGDAMLGLGETSRARDEFVAALVITPEDPDAMLGIVSSYVAEREFMQARATLDEVLSLNNTYIPAWLTSGSLNLRTRSYGSAAENYEQALRLADQQSNQTAKIQALIGLAEAHLGRKEPASATEVVQQIDELAPDSTQALFIKARIAYAEQDWTYAVQTLREVIRRNSDYQPAQVLLGAVHLERGSLGQAEMYLSAAVASDPSDVNARKLLADTRIRQGRTSEASSILGPLLGDDVKDAGALSMAARASAGSGEYDQAAEYISQRLADDPDNTELKLDLAATYLFAGDTERAQSILDGVTENTDADSRRGATLRLLARLARGESEGALQDASALLERWPDDPRLRVLVGSIQNSAGLSTEAVANLEEAIELSPKDVNVYIRLARILSAEGDLVSARSEVMRALDIAPGDARVLTELAIISALMEDRTETRKWLEQARSADLAAIPPRIMLARLHLSNKEFEAASKVAQELIEINDSNAEGHNIYGLALDGKGDNELAIESHRRAVQINNDNPVYRLNLARSLAEHDQVDDALDVLNRTSQFAPNHIPTAVMRVSLYLEKGETDGALDVAGKLEDLYPQSEVPKALLAEVFLARKEFAEAVDAYDESLSIKQNPAVAIRAHQVRALSGIGDAKQPLIAYLERRPFDAGVRMALAQSYQAEGLDEAAIAEYEEVQKSAPDNAAVLNNLAWSYQQIGDPRARAVAEKAFSIDPENSYIADTYGWILIGQGAIDEGVGILRKAVSNGSGTPEHKYHLAAGLAAAGEKQEAADILREILGEEEAFASRSDAEQLLSTL